jgi:hypothetical protein
MQNFIELKTEETKAVVGGLMKGPPSLSKILERFAYEVLSEITGRGATTAMKA